MIYYDREGNEITKEQIQSAYHSGQATLIHTRGDGHTSTRQSLENVQKDTRGQCFSMWDEVWTTKPVNIQDCYAAAR